MAIGLHPWLSAATIFEIAVLLLPASVTKFFSQGHHVNPFSLFVVAAALAFAAPQAYGVSLALEGSGLIQSAGSEFQIGAIASLVGGTAVAIVLARLISTHGVGSGFWVLIAATAVWSLMSYAEQLLTILTQGIIAPPVALLFLAMIAAIITASVVIVLLRQSRGVESHDEVAWPLFVYASVLSFLFLLGHDLAVIAFNVELGHETILASNPLGAAIAITIILSIVTRYATRSNQIALIPVGVALLSAIVIIPEVLWYNFSFYVPAAASLVVLSIVATLGVQQMIRIMPDAPPMPAAIEQDP
jgi:hypothetical protein